MYTRFKRLNTTIKVIDFTNNKVDFDYSDIIQNQQKV